MHSAIHKVTKHTTTVHNAIHKVTKHTTTVHSAIHKVTKHTTTVHNAIHKVTKHTTTVHNAIHKVTKHTTTVHSAIHKVTKHTAYNSSDNDDYTAPAATSQPISQPPWEKPLLSARRAGKTSHRSWKSYFPALSSHLLRAEPWRET